MKTIYIHYNNGVQYQIIDFCKIQQNDEWVDAYIYEQYPHIAGVHNMKFVRSVTEFNAKFKANTTNVLPNDNYSLLDFVRNFQLSDILGKYKLWNT